MTRLGPFLVALIGLVVSAVVVATTANPWGWPGAVWSLTVMCATYGLRPPAGGTPFTPQWSPARQHRPGPPSRRPPVEHRPLGSSRPQAPHATNHETTWRTQ